MNMMAGPEGTFVISWSQTEVDGLSGAPVSAVDEGAMWMWRGDPVQIDGALGGPVGTVRAEEREHYRKRAAASARRIVSRALVQEGVRMPFVDDVAEFDRAFTITDGHRKWTATLIDMPEIARPLLDVRRCHAAAERAAFRRPWHCRADPAVAPVRRGRGRRLFHTRHLAWKRRRVRAWSKTWPPATRSSPRTTGPRPSFGWAAAMSRARGFTRCPICARCAFARTRLGRVSLRATLWCRPIIGCWSGARRPARFGAKTKFWWPRVTLSTAQA